MMTAVEKEGESMQQQKSFANEETQGNLYLVPTPIGNLEDMTFRALKVLQAVDLILAEDTRHTQKLLNHFEIDKPQKSFHKYNTQERIPEILSLLASGKNLAQVSDAGMPVISDPGSELVQACLKAGIPVIPLPGANAALTGLVASGLKSEAFTFIGFLPKKAKDRRQQLMTYQNAGETLMIYESPYRISQTIETAIEVFGPDRPACVVRELTKSYEEFNRGSLAELGTYYQENPAVKGEICFYIEGNPHPKSAAEQLQAGIDHLPLKGQVEWWMEEERLSSKEAIKKVAKNKGLKKQEVYQAYHEIGGEAPWFST